MSLPLQWGPSTAFFFAQLRKTPLRMTNGMLALRKNRMTSDDWKSVSTSSWASASEETREGSSWQEANGCGLTIHLAPLEHRSFGSLREPQDDETITSSWGARSATKDLVDMGQTVADSTLHLAPPEHRSFGSLREAQDDVTLTTCLLLPAFLGDNPSRNLHLV